MAERAWQKFTAAVWPKAKDPSIHVDLTVDAGPLLSVVEAAAQAGHRVTPTAFITRAVGDMLAEHPEANVTIKRGKVRDRQAIDAWVTMSDMAGHLGGRRLDHLDERTVVDIQEEIGKASRPHKASNGTRAHTLYRWIGRLPLPIVRALVAFSGFLVHTIGIKTSLFGVGAREGFGAVHISNVGPFGLRHVAAPIPPFMNQGYLFVIGEIHEAPMVRDGEVVPGQVLPITGTVDHRLVVGDQAARWAATLQERLTSTDHLTSYLPEELRDEVQGALGTA